MNNLERILEIEKEKEELYEKIEEKESKWNFFDPNNSFEKYQEYFRPEYKRLGELSREERMIMVPEFEEIPDYGDVMPLKEFVECVNSGGFIDYDGYGNYVKDNKMSNITIHPSDVKHNSVRKDFETIIWFNK